MTVPKNKYICAFGFL